MTSVALTGYALAAIAYLALLAMMIANWHGGGTARWLGAAIAVSGVWCANVTYQLYNVPGIVMSAGDLLGGEILRDVAWLVVLGRLLRQASGSDRSPRWITLAIAAISVLAVIAIAALGVPASWIARDADLHAVAVRIAVLSLLLMVSVFALVLVEQLFRSVVPAQRWKVKYLCFGLGGLFAFDFYMYSEALLFQAVDINEWGARGYVNVLMVPLIGIALARNPDWSSGVHVSRKMVFHTVTLLGAGAYLIAMSIAGYYIRFIGGDWGLVGQTVFLFCAVVLLFAVMFSGEARARLKVFFNKHFARAEYDYREEWRTITDVLSGAPLEPGLRERALTALADVVESTGGALFRRGSDGFRVAASTNLTLPAGLEVRMDDPIVRFLIERSWVINLDEYRGQPQVYGDLQLPEWLRHDPRAWLIVPLLQHEELYGFVVLAQGRAPVVTNWEVRDMLLMTGRQIAGHLALLDANEALIEARQFEAFNRLSAYVVHDLKNLIAQLSLVVSNAARHRANPAFMDDAIATVGNAVDKMSRLLAQLRMGRLDAGDARRVSLVALVQDAIRHRSGGKPVPTFAADQGDCFVVANPDRLTAVVEHLVQNAQDATPADGTVEVRLARDAVGAELTVADTGSGMDPVFMREHLFRPFRTTKGNAGMGIGVYESREFLRAIGGRLDVRSEVGRGTTFTLRIPLHRPNSGANPNQTTSGTTSDGEGRSEGAFGR
jgi:putative PEP-CTERM system histidine kinase